MRILLVEDDLQLGEGLNEALTDEGYVVDWVTDGEMGWIQATDLTYDLMVLDVMLPKINGIHLCRRLRETGRRLPILMLTARDTNTDKVAGLDAGADDYVVKPFDLLELLARLRALLRRGTLNDTGTMLVWGQAQLDSVTHEVFYDGSPLQLTPKEFSLLELFLRSGRRVLSRSVLIDQCWATNALPDEETVKSHLKSLRQKLKKAGAPADFIETVHGVGYRLKQS
ncbi:DNA-binding response regulator [Leptolyngbyaceae cyanobacterium CCMR0082]|uniref:DNA-binding response regulator n=1 Tax=Adonisia turfae CCMR0082 TaxID=2304604 RepID=A0A6M0S5W6_9CYAN|nr:response regulator transcription factor [Adonisia turfae]MDV3353619.1 response regulator transcription factor [Leptothoe sp. LEGE 181152]NEZ63884.1 DNA-binding response regulator [Adonisia turfae CCMR0082]